MTYYQDPKPTLKELIAAFEKHGTLSRQSLTQDFGFTNEA